MKPTREYKQSKDESWAKQTITAKGACFGLSIYWIVKAKKKEDFWKWLGTAQSKADVVSIMEKQAEVVDKAPAGTGSAAKIKLATELLNRLAGLNANNEDGDPNDVFPVDTKEGYKYISIGGGNEAGDFQHAVAALVEDGKARVFDPNFGEFEGDKEELPDFITKTLIGTNYKVAIDKRNTLYSNYI